MSIRRTLTKGVALATLLLLIAAPAGAATSDTTTRGTAATTSLPLSIEALNQPTAELGRTVLMATTDSDKTTLAPWSTVQLTLAKLGGASFGEASVSSDGVTAAAGPTVDRATSLAAVEATAGNLLALADDTTGTATSLLTTLTTDATVLNALGLSATISDVVTTVNDGGATATHSLGVAGIDLDLAHVLGSVLDQLPLSDLIALADELGVEVPVNLDPVNGVVTATEELITAVTAAVTAADAVDTAVNDLLAADGGTLALLQSLEADIDALITAGTVDLTTVNALISILTDPLLSSCTLEPTLVTLAQDLLDAASCVDGLITNHLATLGDELTALEAAVTNYVDAVAAAATAAASADTAAGGLTVSDIIADIEALIADLLAADLVGIGPIDVSQRVRAVGGQLDASSASHTCEVTTVAALGADPVEVADCNGASDTLTAVVDTITGTLQTVLDTVEGVDAGDGVSLELFGTVEDAVTDGGDGWVRATSVMEVLTLTIPDITVAPCDIADGLVCGLGIDIDGTLTTILDTLDGALAAAEGVAETAINTVGVSELLTALGAADLITQVTNVDAGTVQTAVDNAVAALTGVLDGLIDGLGDLGTAGGTTITGATITVDPSLEAEHQVVTAAGDPGNPADAAPDPDDDPSLPNTGGGAALLAALAIGAGAWLWRRREAH